MVCCYGILNTIYSVSVCTNLITLLEKVHKKAVTSQDVVGADIVLWFLNSGGNHSWYVPHTLYKEDMQSVTVFATCTLLC